MCKEKRIIKNITKAENFINDEKKSYILFIGIEKYKEKEIGNVLIKEESTLYDISNGNVAFIPQNKRYTGSFLSINKMIFNSFDYGEKILHETDTTHLVRYLYNNGYIFLNVEDIDIMKLKGKINAFEQVFICGEDVAYRNAKLLEKKSKIVKLFETNKIGIKTLIHPSSVNYNKPNYEEQWIHHRFNGNISLEDIIIFKRKKC